jgi:hypothetical protein
MHTVGLRKIKFYDTYPLFETAMKHKTDDHPED